TLDDSGGRDVGVRRCGVDATDLARKNVEMRLEIAFRIADIPPISIVVEDVGTEVHPFFEDGGECVVFERCVLALSDQAENRRFEDVYSGIYNVEAELVD